MFGLYKSDIATHIRNTIVSGTVKWGRSSQERNHCSEKDLNTSASGMRGSPPKKQISIGAQVEELKKAGCVVFFQDTVSSADKARHD